MSRLPCGVPTPTNAAARRRRSPALLPIAIGILCITTAAGGATLPLSVALETGQSRSMEFQLDNRCPKRATFRLQLSGNLSGIATLSSDDPRVRQQLVTGGAVEVLPGEPARIEVRITPAASGRFAGVFSARCTNCGKRCRQAAGSGGVSEHRVEVHVVDLEPFRRRAERFVGSTGADLPVRLVDLRVLEQIEDAEQTAFEVLISSAFMKRPSAVKRLDSEDPGDTETGAFIERHRDEIRDAVDEMLSRGFVREGWLLVAADWRHDDGREFSTLGIADRNGEARFEPVLHFHGKATMAEVAISSGEPTTGPDSQRGRFVPREDTLRVVTAHAFGAGHQPARAIRRASWSVPARQEVEIAPAARYLSWKIENGFGRDCVHVGWEFDPGLACTSAGEQVDLQVTYDARAPDCILWRHKTLVGDACGRDDGGELSRSWVVKIWYKVGIGEHLSVDETSRGNRAGRMRLTLRDADWDRFPQGTTVRENPGQPFGHASSNVVTDRTGRPPPRAVDSKLGDRSDG